MKANLLASDKEEVDGMSLVELADKYPEFLRGRISIEFDYIFMSDEEKAKKDYSYVRFNQLMNAEPIDWRDPDYATKRNKYILETGKNPSTNEPATEAEIITAKNYGWVKAIPDTVAWTDMMVGSYVGHQVYNGKPIYGLDTDFAGRVKIPSTRIQPVVPDINPEGGINNNIAKEPISRPTWRQSELDVGKDYEGYDAQKSFINGEEVPYGTKGSVRPEFYKNGHSVEVKNYDIETSSGRNSLINNVSSQIKKRLTNLPEGTEQTVVIDVRGQEYNLEILRDIKNKIIEKSGYNAEILFKRE